jgi:hypothetical protein
VTSRATAWRLPGLLRRRAALGLQPVTAPVMLFVPLGVVLGPSGANIISPAALSHLDIVVTIALATLGVLIGLAAAPEARTSSRLLGASAVEALITIGIVGGALVVLLTLWGLQLGVPVLVAAAALGVCASASSANADDDSHDEARQIAARVADLDDVVPIVLGAMVLAYVGPTGTSLWWKLGSTIGLGLAIAVCGWLLLERARGAAERGVFVLGVLALLGGAPAYLQLSPLLAGLAAGWFWVAAPGGCDRLVTTELRKVQHPLIVLLLITAGAWLGPNLIGVWLFVPFVVFRLAGKLLGGWAASRIAGGATPTSLGAYLVPPGVIGIAFALNLHQVATDGAAALVFAVTVGSVASEAIALVVTPPPHQT